MLVPRPQKIGAAIFWCDQQILKVVAKICQRRHGHHFHLADGSNLGSVKTLQKRPRPDSGPASEP